MDDWGLAPCTAENRHDLLELLDDRHGVRSTVVTSQLPVNKWGMTSSATRRSPTRSSTVSCTMPTNSTCRETRCESEAGRRREPRVGTHDGSRCAPTGGSTDRTRTRTPRRCCALAPPGLRKTVRVDVDRPANALPAPTSRVGAPDRRRRFALVNRTPYPEGALWICRGCGRPRSVASNPSVGRSGRPQPLGNLADNRCRSCLRFRPRDSHSPTAHRRHGSRSSEHEPCTTWGPHTGQCGRDDGKSRPSRAQCPQARPERKENRAKTKPTVDPNKEPGRMISSRVASLRQVIGLRRNGDRFASEWVIGLRRNG